MKAIFLNSILAVVLVSAVQVGAAPILNENVSGSRDVTIYRDHFDPNLYYVAPSRMGVTFDKSGLPVFSYVEYKDGPFEKKAVVQTTLSAEYLTDELRAAEAGIFAQNNAAKFSGLPFYASTIVFGSQLQDFIAARQCSGQAGIVGAEQTCSFELTSKGVRTLHPLWKRTTAIAMTVEYTVVGVLRTANGSFVNGQSSFGIAARIGSSLLSAYPSLFRESSGKALRD